MHLSRFSRPLAALALALGVATLAQAQPHRRELNSFQDNQMTLEERNAARAKPRYNINAYGKDVKVKEEHFPWMALGLAAIAFAVSAPFAWRLYRGASRDIAAANTFGVSGNRSSEDASPE